MNTRRAAFLLTLMVLGVSSSAVLAVWLLEGDVDPRRTVTLALWRCAGGAVALGLVAVRSRTVRLDRRQLRRMSLSGALLGLHFALFLGSLAFTSVASSTTLATMAPVVVAIGSVVWLREPPERRVLAGMGLALTAAIALGLSDLLAIPGWGAALGDLMAFASAVVIAGSLVIGRAERGAVPAVQYSAVVFAVAAVTLALVVLVTGSPWVPWRGTEWLAVAGMVAGPQLLGHFLIQTLLADLQPVVVSTAVLAEPIAASLLAWGLLAQPPPAWLAVTGPLVLVGVAVAVTGRAASGPPPAGPSLEA